MVRKVITKKFKEINLQSSFFDSLKQDYREFCEWFQRKAEEEAYVIYNEQQQLDAFLYLKTEPQEEIDSSISPKLPEAFRLKIGTLKVAEEGQGNKYGEGLLKIAFDVARRRNVNNIYVTLFSHHRILIELLKQMGFERYGIKSTENGMEEVYIHFMSRHFNKDHPIKSYPYIPRNPMTAVRIVPIEAEYHSLLFPGSELKGAIHDIDEYIPASNAIRKIYLAGGTNAKLAQTGDLLFFYRKKHPDEPSMPKYKSAITTLGIVEKVYVEGRDYKGFDEYSKIAGRRTVFTQEELKQQYELINRRVIVQFIYVLSFGSGNNVNYQFLVDNKIIPPRGYWGFLPITNTGYHLILEEAGIDDSYFID